MAGGQPQTSSGGHAGGREVEVGPEDTGFAAASSASHCGRMASPFLKGDLSGTLWAATEAGQKGIVGMGLESQRMGQRVGGRRHADREFSKTNERQQVTDSCKM